MIVNRLLIYKNQVQ